MHLSHPPPKKKAMIKSQKTGWAKHINQMGGGGSDKVHKMFTRKPQRQQNNVEDLKVDGKCFQIEGADGI
jgi:hypothetical protein